jgi:hypothetical protein
MATRVGKTLLEARTERGIDLYEVQRVTKIRVQLLRAMEEDRWEELPAPAHTRGLLSTYARFLGLDDAPLVEEYTSTIEGADRPEPVPQGVLQRGVLRQRQARKGSRSIKPAAVWLTGIAAAAAVALVIIGSLGGSDNGSSPTAHHRKHAGSAGGTTSAETPAQASEVSVELRPTAAVWVCLVDDRGRALVPGETLAADQARGPYSGRSFDVTFGNGSIEMTVDGELAEIPPVARPLGYRIGPRGVRKLDPASGPTCL